MTAEEKKISYTILIIDDDVNFCRALERNLRDDYSILITHGQAEARNLLWRADLILLDIRLTESDDRNQDGLKLLSEFRAERPQLPIIMMTAYGDISTAVAAMKAGASDFLTKPVELPKLRKTIENALKQAQLLHRVKNLERELTTIEPLELIGQNEKLKSIRQLIDYVAKDGYITVLIKGETGTGKELVAKLIHKRGWRSEGPFVALSLSALAPSIVERELFGHERGAFTDARESSPGYIEQAHKGVLFLDDIDAAPPEVQPKLLRFLEERCIYRLGSTKPICVDVQVIAATNQNLPKLIEEKKFREDLYYRINSLEINLPPLRDHAEDIPYLCQHFLRIYQLQGRTGVKGITKEAEEALKRYSWPGNVRELRNVVERACIMAGARGHKLIELEDLPAEMQTKAIPATAHPGENREAPLIDLEREKARLELAQIEKALEKAGGKKTEAWKLLGLNDRFALRRRVLSIKKKYPELIKEFKLINSKF